MTRFKPHHVEWSEEKVSRFWDFLATHDAGGFFSESHAQDLALRVLRLRPRSVLDIGCGTGPLVAELAARGVEAIGVDSSPGVLEAAAVRAPRARFYLGSVTKIPLADASVDAATLIEVVEHLDDDALDRAIREAHRVVRPGGFLFITTPNTEDLDAVTRQCPDCGAEFHIFQHVRRWTAATLRDYLGERGFTAAVKPAAFREPGLFGWLLPLGHMLLRGKLPRLLAIGTRRQ